MSRLDDALLSEFARRSGVGPRELRRYEEWGLLSLGEEAHDELVSRVRRIRRLRRHLGLSYDAIELVLRLVDRIERLEGEPAGATSRTTVVRILR
ncbi:MAG TPA: MerR family transcriptional regulator [Candidatus Sulfotelmatobacter sp.]|nr:MerR family transcriptional regulator [Candidatus Sulfotelmatobacter sp.]